MRVNKASSIKSLLFGVAGQQAETNWDAMVQRHARQARCRGATDIVKVGGAASDYGIQGNHSIEAGPGTGRRSQRKRFTPLEFWRGESVVYGHSEGSEFAVIVDVATK